MITDLPGWHFPSPWGNSPHFSLQLSRVRPPGTGRSEAEPNPHAQGHPNESWTHEQPRAVGSAWNTSRAGAEVPEANSSVGGWSPRAGACSVGSLPGAGHTRDTNLARAAHPAAPQARALRGSPELGCSLGHPGWGHPAAPDSLHGGKRQSGVILWGQGCVVLAALAPCGLGCPASTTGDTRVSGTSQGAAASAGASSWQGRRGASFVC